jgi:hypothetical protein
VIAKKILRIGEAEPIYYKDSNKILIMFKSSLTSAVVTSLKAMLSSVFALISTWLVQRGGNNYPVEKGY